ncbi:MAG: hypothetical protein ACRBN8_12940 [Nannocystales bacterium]
MRRLGVMLLLCGVGCGKAHRPSKGFVAQEMQCKRSGLSMSEVFEDTWVGEDGAMRVRYRVGASCAKPKVGPVAPIDVWQECRWSSERWDCDEWKTGTRGGLDRPAATYLDAEERGR